MVELGQLRLPVEQLPSGYGGSNPSTSTGNMKVKDLTDSELIDKYKKGEKWLTQNAQVTGTDKTESGTKYNPEAFDKALRAYEALSDEMNTRGLAL